MTTYGHGQISSRELRKSFIYALAVSFGLFAAWAGLLFDYSRTQISSVILLVALAGVARRSVGFVFLCVAVLHLIVGYWASYTGPTIGVPENSNAFQFLETAHTIYVVGLVSAILSYAAAPDLGWTAPRWILAPNVLRVNRRVQILVICGLGLCVMVLTTVGIPLLDPSLRYFGEDTTTNYGVLQALLRRGLVFLGVSIAVLLPLRRFWVSAVCVLVMVLCARRGSLITAILSFLLVEIICHKRYKIVLGSIGAFVLVLLILQSVFLSVWDLPDVITQVDVLAYALRSVVGEVRDLGWTLSEWSHHWFYGRTWIAALLPVPASLSSFKALNNLPAVTKNIIGVAEDANAGGLRISAFGEGYLNFGYFGAVMVGGLLGPVLKILDRVHATLRDSPPIAYLPAAYLMVSTFQLYLSGSSIASDQVLSFVLLLLLYIPFGKSREVQRDPCGTA